MSTLEKAITLLEDMPEQKIETIYTFIQFIHSQTNETFPSAPEKKRKRNLYLASPMNTQTPN